MRGWFTKGDPFNFQSLALTTKQGNPIKNSQYLSLYNVTKARPAMVETSWNILQIPVDEMGSTFTSEKIPRVHGIQGTVSYSALKVLSSTVRPTTSSCFLNLVKAISSTAQV